MKIKFLCVPYSMSVKNIWSLFISDSHCNISNQQTNEPNQSFFPLGVEQQLNINKQIPLLLIKIANQQVVE